MKKTSAKIVFFGNEKLATGIDAKPMVLSSLSKQGCNIVAHVTGATQKDKLSDLSPDIGILVAYGEIIPKFVINSFPHGIVNIHPSLLPKHRGPTPIESCILDGDKQTGVSLMQLSSKMDAGPVFAQTSIRLTGKETKQELADNLLHVGQVMLSDLLADIISGDVVAKPQNDSEATYDSIITKKDGLIDWDKPADRIEREIRAFAGWPGSRASLRGYDVIITSSEVISHETDDKPGTVKIKNDEIHIVTANRVLSVKKLKPAGKREMTAAEFIRGYGSRL